MTSPVFIRMPDSQAEAQRLALAKKRILKLLARQTVCVARTIEHKLHATGPNPQRIDPHVTTNATRELLFTGQIGMISLLNTHWYHLPESPRDLVEAKLEYLSSLYSRVLENDFVLRTGQALEIAVFRSLLALRQQDPSINFLGHFRDLDGHPDSELYSKEEPPRAINARHIRGRGRVDFALLTPAVCVIEVKNGRPVIYPSNKELTELLSKAVDLDAVPILVARRLHPTVVQTFSRTGLLVHETYGQRYPAMDAELANQVKHKDALGWHDIRVGNEPDARMLKFFCDVLPQKLEQATEDFQRCKGLLRDFADGAITFDDVQRLKFSL
jgi:hypothetical protein